ncbi:hypothetical protein HALLA_20475 (plasmid) [Halostagnicola larsenii XH-48]|uniref:Uncharacterized protein n=1 Tax=Halostagnicola larsenii XH-48 TaxID=797299 RepID=W0JYM2_9EURY|nr:hypothetical protein [Halostagnicola larsenii]AHG02280.1 hypothetical protein HALLA_20475 [Halostagnicola larsenii XH-48]
MTALIDPGQLDSSVGFDVPAEFSSIALHTVTARGDRRPLDARETFSPAVVGRPIETSTRERDENNLEVL